MNFLIESRCFFHHALFGGRSKKCVVFNAFCANIYYSSAVKWYNVCEFPCPFFGGGALAGAGILRFLKRRYFCKEPLQKFNAHRDSHDYFFVEYFFLPNDRAKFGDRTLFSLSVTPSNRSKVKLWQKSCKEVGFGRVPYSQLRFLFSLRPFTLSI